MASLARVKVRWQIPNGGLGYSVFHFGDGTDSFLSTQQAQDCVAKTDTFITNVLSLIPSSVTLQTLPEVELIDSLSGDLQGFKNVTTNVAKNGTAAAASFYMAAVGAVITWRTAGIRNGRRVRGRTFLVPTSGGAWDTNGTLNTGANATLNTAATALSDQSANMKLGVFGRPSSKGATDGVWFPLSGYTIPDAGAVLRSRRD